MYDAQEDPYCYPATVVLKNIPGLRTQEELDAFEAASTMQRADEPLPTGRLTLSHYKAIHHHLFQDVYPWAGKFRSVRMSKDRSAFCYPEYIVQEMKALFGSLAAKRFLRNLTLLDFARDAAEFLATLNAIHPFREGNGRTQTLFLALLADYAGHPLDLEKLSPEPFLAAMVRSFRGELKPLRAQIEYLAG
jgi:cell filamentation protein